MSITSSPQPYSTPSSLALPERILRVVAIASLLVAVAVCGLEFPARAAGRGGALGLAAWFATLAIGYALGRWFLPTGAREVGQRAVTRALLVGVALLAIALSAAVGVLVFVRPLAGAPGTPTHAMWGWLLLVWACAPAIGVAFGQAAKRAALRWRRIRLRAVIGTPPLLTPYRSAPAPPAFMARTAAPRSRAAIIAACVRAGYRVGARGRRLELVRAGVPTLRIRGTRRGPWLPEHLRVAAFDAADATPLVRELTEEFGPLEYTPAAGGSVILNPARW